MSPRARRELFTARTRGHSEAAEDGAYRERGQSAAALLTPREVDCLRWVLKGKSDTDIGRTLDISHTTVHFHIERAKKKLGVKTRGQAAAIVISLGYL
jgi:DNA-binding CsgD family transcriptional regulator